MSRHRLGLALVALPVAISTALVGPGMVSRADGCSGGPGIMGPGWHGLSGVDDTALPTTGAVALEGTLKGLAEGAALEAVTVSVEDAAAQPVAGSLSLHDVGRDPNDITHEARRVLVVWRPAAPLEPKGAYQVTWAIAEAAVSGSYPPSSGALALETVSEPAKPASVTVSQIEFGRERILSGETVSCQHAASVNSCGPSVSSFGSTEVQAPVLHLAFAPPPSAASIHQLTRIEAVPGKGQLVSKPEAFVNVPPYGAAAHSVTLQFSDEVDEYCVRLVTEDLTTGKQSVLPSVCAQRTDAVAPGPSLLEARLVACDAPPTTELEGAWCASHPDASQCSSTAGCSTAPSGRSNGAPLAGLLALGLVGAAARRRRPA